MKTELTNMEKEQNKNFIDSIKSNLNIIDFQLEQANVMLDRGLQIQMMASRNKIENEKQQLIQQRKNMVTQMTRLEEEIKYGKEIPEKAMLDAEMNS